MNYFVYVMASKPYGTLYIGMTDDLVNRVYQHKNNLVDGFTKKYKIHNLVYYEAGEDVSRIIEREKQLKKWNRYWKIKLIEKTNPKWDDLYEKII